MAQSVTPKLPTYCPLELAFDADRLRRELSRLRPHFESLATTKAMIDRRSEWFSLGEDELYENVEHIAVSADRPGERSFVPGSVPSWWGIGLTHVPDEPDTRWGGSRHRRAFDGRWAWKEDLAISYARQLTGGLRLRRIDNVRVMFLAAGGFGPAHVDWRDDTPWETEDLASITFLVDDGGVPMRFRGTDGTLHDVRDPAFFFKDCAPHGVPRTRGERLLLRINGAMDRARLRSLLREERAIA